jgi:hypothetical protein
MGRWTFQETSTAPAPAIPGRRVGPASAGAGSLTEQVGVPAVAVCAWAFWDPDWHVWGPAVAVVAVLTFLATWAVLMSDSRGLLRVAESWEAWSRPAEQGPQDRIVLVRAGKGDGAQGDGAQGDGVELPPPDPQATEPPFFESFMAAAMASTALGDLERRWPRPTVQRARDALIEAGLATWAGKGRNAGWALTERGRSVAERCRRTLAGVSE